ncbi:potassium channel family protein [Microbacteriaceae bacterium K1510]|nr:potassium channel family protein [Microbacteriaceae bacterium K1510]
MLRQILIGGVISLCNIAIHAAIMTVVVTAAHRVSKWDYGGPKIWLAGVMIATVGILMLAHLAEVMIWALSYEILNAAAPEADVMYFAFVNYATLGYGDVVPVARWRLLGPMTAMNGALLFGWSTAVMFEVLRSAMRVRDFRAGTTA